MFVRLTVLACIVVSISCYASAQTDSAPQETLSATSAAEAANEKSEQKQPEAAAAALQSVESAAPEDERLPYEVITLMIKTDWTETLKENKALADELSALYKDVDLSGAGLLLEEFAPQLFFPVDRAAVYRIADGKALTRRLQEVGLVKELKQTPQPPEQTTFGPSFAVSTIDAPEVSLEYLSRVYGNAKLAPFSKLSHHWTIRVASAGWDLNTILVDRQLTLYVETQWPVKTKLKETTEKAILRSGLRTVLPDGCQTFMCWQNGQSGTLIDQDENWIQVIGISRRTPDSETSDVAPSLQQPYQTAEITPFDYHRTEAVSPPSQVYDTTSHPVQSSPAGSGQQKQQVTVYALKHAPAAEVAELLEQLFVDSDDIRILPDPRTNAIIVRALHESPVFDIVPRLIEALDSAKAPSASENAPNDQFRRIEDFQVHTTADDGLLIQQGDASALNRVIGNMSRYRKRQLEAQGNKLQSEAIRQAQQLHKSQPSQTTLQSLRDLVSQEFEIRQRVQLAEIQFLRSRLEDLEKRIRQKEQLREQIIERRIESLLEDLSTEEEEEKVTY
jgi:hypothetical protein